MSNPRDATSVHTRTAVRLFRNFASAASRWFCERRECSGTFSIYAKTKDSRGYLECAEHLGEKLHHAAGIAENDGRGLVQQAFLGVFLGFLGVLAGIHWV